MPFQTLPRWFRAVFVAVMLALCLTVVTQVTRQYALARQFTQLTAELDISRQRLRKQQLELQQAQTALPLMEAELAIIAPQAAAIYEEEQDLRAQRKALRAENKTLQADLTALTEAVATDPTVLEAATAASALENVLHDLQQILTLLK